MDWGTIAVSSLTSGSFVAVAAFVGKRLVDRSLDVRVARLTAVNKAFVAEQMRQQAFMWDEQYQASKALLSLLYRLRLAFRDLVEGIGSGPPNRVDKALHRKVRTYLDAIREVLIEERAVLPSVTHQIVHDLTTPTTELGFLLGNVTDRGHHVSEEELEALVAAFRRVDAIYSALTELAHSSFHRLGEV